MLEYRCNFKEIYAWEIRVDSVKDLAHSAMDEDWRFRNRQFNCKVNSLFSSYLPFAFFPVSINSYSLPQSKYKAQLVFMNQKYFFPFFSWIYFRKPVSCDYINNDSFSYKKSGLKENPKTYIYVTIHYKKMSNCTYIFTTYVPVNLYTIFYILYNIKKRGITLIFKKVHIF